ncbi:MAG: hypothetical protein H6739_30150 [Alphaproteobacteria bacterium]|nr:hypothetical protein [Alphaproteobacteria bacterium]
MILLVSEGQRDFGDEEGPWCEDPDREGPLRPLVAALLHHPDGLFMRSRKLGKVHGTRRRHGIGPTQRGLAFKVERVIRDAVRDGCDGVIVVIDQDSRAGADRRALLARLEEGRAAAAATPCALGVAQPMVEAWLMGDPGAWARAFGPIAPSPQGNPETTTGAGGSPRYAKAVLEALLKQAGCDEVLVGYTQVARASDVEVLIAACAVSFKPFAEEVRGRIGPLYGVRG